VISPKILIVGDDAVARSLRDQLTSLGYDVPVTVTSPEAAVDLTTAHAPRAVVVDARRENGASLRSAVDDLFGRSNIPVVLLVEPRSGADAERTRGTRRYEYVEGPFTARELGTTIELAVCRHDAARVEHELDDRFFTVSVDLLCFLDFNGYFKRLNPSWERTLGFTPQELMSKPFIEFVHPEDRERTLSQNREVRSGGHALSFENRYLCKDGSYRWFRWNAAPDATERVIYSVARDVTEAKQAEEERERLVRELQAALAEVKTLRAILPICSYCRKIRDDENYWHTVEGYISRHTATRFSHGICPTCMAEEVETQLGALGGD
jgi:PAS domain S-box-containing protein